MKREPDLTRLDHLLDARIDPLDDVSFQAELDRDEELLSAFVAWRSIERELQCSATPHTPHVPTMRGARIAMCCAAALLLLAAGTWFVLRERGTATEPEHRSEDRDWRPLPAGEACAVLHFEASVETNFDRERTVWKQSGLGHHAASHTHHYVDASLRSELAQLDVPARTK